MEAGRAYYHLEDYAAAIQTLKALQKRKDFADYPKAMAYLVSAYEKNGNKKAADQLYNQVSKEFPDFKDLFG